MINLCVPKRSLLFCPPYGFSGSPACFTLSPRTSYGGAVTGSTVRLNGQVLKIRLVLPGSRFLPLRSPAHRIFEGLGSHPGLPRCHSSILFHSIKLRVAFIGSYMCSIRQELHLELCFSHLQTVDSIRGSQIPLHMGIAGEPLKTHPRSQGLCCHGFAASHGNRDFKLTSRFWCRSPGEHF